MKGVLQPDHIPRSKYKFIVSGGPDLTAVMVSGIEEELDRVELPDRTAASGGRTKPFEFNVTIPAHHTEERLFFEFWFAQCQGDVDPSYKKACTIIRFSLSGAQRVTYGIVGVFPRRRNLDDAEMDNEGEESEIEWVMSGDQVVPR